MTKRRKFIIIIIALLALGLGGWAVSRHPAVQNIGGNAGNASLTIKTPATDIYNGQAFTAEVVLDTAGDAVNVAGFVMSFNPRFLEIINMTTEKSFCSFYVENSFDNIKGKVEISCGVPNPGFKGTSTIVSISMRPKLSGSSQMTIAESTAEILANDGKGTNLINKIEPATINVKATF